MISERNIPLVVEREREHLVESVACPVCDMPPRKPCFYDQLSVSTNYFAQAHTGRYNAAVKAGLVPPLPPPPPPGQCMLCTKVATHARTTLELCEDCAAVWDIEESYSPEERDALEAMGTEAYRAYAYREREWVTADD